MDSFARNALRLTLAGAGVVVLGAGFIGQASAAELPDAPSAPEAPDTSLPADQDLPLEAADDVTTDVGTPLSTSADSAPTSDVLFDDLPPLEIPGVMYIEAPTVS
ncbi:hypothetical protein EV383_0075 [Pseudonocardia sediminis]|uniref:Uncharacterized protein n=1 Tax=Pseudonocardia sediminis TaxID=1397368 RepID=A0A4Q7UP53_PSEST|nr:hypothetical protein [Pseudonocardia sediminis]RZT83276.1 hypothetical protein EV383_0075 [Pseudonocardia sediminis]